MRETEQSRIVGLLGVGFDTEDGHIRMTDADDYKVLMGSNETHEALQKICNQISESIQASGRPLCDYSPEEFMEMVKTLY